MKLDSKIKYDKNSKNGAMQLGWCNGCMFICTDCVLSCGGTCSDICTGSMR